ncbi:MAG: hypothetical protein ACKVP4_14605 [Hyphomicrobium sp.]
MFRFLYICAEAFVFYAVLVGIGAALMWFGRGRGFDEVEQLILLGFAIIAIPMSFQAVLGIRFKRGSWVTGYYRPVRILSLLIPGLYAVVTGRDPVWARQKPESDAPIAPELRDGRRWGFSGARGKRTAYVAASGGVLGTGLWLAGPTLRALAARHVTGVAVAMFIFVALVIRIAAMKLDADAVASVAGWAVPVALIVYLVGHVERAQRDYWTAAHGAGTPEFDAAVDAETRAADERIGKDDWLVYPPWKQPARR